MNNGKLRTASAGFFMLAASGSAFAQDTTEYQPPETTQVQADAQVDTRASAQTEVGMGLPGAETTETPAATTTTTAAAVAPNAGGSDHEGVVGRLAIGYLGRSGMQVGIPGDGGQALSTPVIGVRYWMDPGLGLDLGLGFGMQGSSVEEDGAEADGPTFWGLILHGGVPLALSTGRHYVFEIIPEANVGFGSGSGDTIDHSGFMLDVGARAGAEIHFGFIGIPELSLQASVGALFSMQSASTTVDTAAGETDSSASSWALRTTVQNSPWNIFTSNVAAFYYF